MRAGAAGEIQQNTIDRVAERVISWDGGWALLGVERSTDIQCLIYIKIEPWSSLLI